MTGPCSECRDGSEYKEFRDKALEFNSELEAQFNGSIGQNGRPFLGRCYAHSRNILFTINPGPNPDRRFSAGLLDNNHHWEGAGKARFKNWSLARRLFRGMSESAPWVLLVIAHMTDQFIVPWASRDWRSMEKNPAWPAIRNYSTKLLELSLRHHQPDLVFLSGKTTLRLFFDFLGIPRPKAAYSRSARNKAWACEVFQLEGNALSGVPKTPLIVVRLPHFSRGSYREFEAIGKWVGETIAAIQVASE